MHEYCKLCSLNPNSNIESIFGKNQKINIYFKHSLTFDSIRLLMLSSSILVGNIWIFGFFLAMNKNVSQLNSNTCMLLKIFQHKLDPNDLHIRNS